MFNIVIFGAPGSGKGTQAAFIEKKFAVKHLSTGDLFRKHLKEETSLGSEVQSYLSQGKLVPDNITVDMVREALKDQPDQAFLFDGFPRTITQANDLDALLKPRLVHRVGVVIFLEVPEEELMRRLLQRGAEQNRQDDIDQQVIKSRIATYHKVTTPVKGFYTAKGVLRLVDGTGSVAKIADTISQIIQESLEGR